MTQRHLCLYRLCHLIGEMEQRAVQMLISIPSHNAEDKASYREQARAAIYAAQSVMQNLNDLELIYKITVLIYLLKLYILLVDPPCFRCRPFLE